MADRSADLPTPSLILDEAKMKANIARMEAQVERLGVAFRPHVKTAKSLPVARAMLGDRPAKITVSTLAEARYFLDAGIDDILYAVGLVPQKVDDIAELMADGARVTVILDSREAAKAAAERAAALDVELPVLIEIDSDGHRAGIAPDDEALIETARQLAERRSTNLLGVMTHAGASYDCRSTESLKAMAAQERDRSVAAAERLRDAGFDCRVVSIGSTPTATFADDMEGVTELRAGVYVFQDLVQAGLGVCGIEDIALSVLASVIGHQRAKNWLITDAGWTALSRDRGTADQEIDQGYGLVMELDGPTGADLVVISVNQEHGIIARHDGGDIDFTRFPLGTKLRILPNHACATAEQHARYHVVDRAGDVVDRWPRRSGWSPAVTG